MLKKIDMNCPKFKERINTLRVQHAVVQGGQRIFLLVFTSLFKGPKLIDIKEYVRSQLPSKRQFKDSFTRAEQNKLEAGDYQNWDISLLFKLFQQVCGLEPNVSEWKNLRRNTLEKLLDELKDLRNEMAHDLTSILTKEERNKKLEELLDLCFEILIKLNGKAHIADNIIDQHQEFIESIIEDVRKEINECSVGNAQSASEAGAVSKNVSAAAASPTSSFAAGSAASAFSSAAADSSKSVYAAAASADSAIGGGSRPAAASHGEYYYDCVETMYVDESYETSSREVSIIDRLKSNILKYAGPGWITV